MRLRMQMQAPDLAEVFKAQVARGFTAAMKSETRQLEKQFEAATESAGLGPRLARTWASRVYPVGRDVLGPAGQIWSKAPGAMRAFTEGANIKPVFARMLAIPTPDGLRMMGGKRGSPVEALRRLRVSSIGRGSRRRRVLDRGIELEVVPLPRGKKATAAIVTRGATLGQSGRVRPATARRAALGFREQRIVLFWLVPRVTIRKRLNLPPMVQAAQARLRTALAQVIADAERSLGPRR